VFDQGNRLYANSFSFVGKNRTRQKERRLNASGMNKFAFGIDS